MDTNKELKQVPLAGELPETKMPTPEPTPTPTIIDLSEPKDYSHLPVGTQASLELDKKSIANPVTPKNELPNNNVSKSVLKSDFSKKFFKIGLGILGVFVACLVIFLILSVTNIDTQIIKITLNGKVTDVATGSPIKDASIYIGNSEVSKTSESGEYSVSNLSSGDISVTVKADGYDDLTETVKVSKVLLDYSTKKDFALKSSITGVLSGKFVTNIPDYKFTNDKLLIGEKAYTIADDGSFSVNNIKVGTVKFTFSSSSFKDISQDINVQSGTNKIPDFTLSPAGDIVGELKSYVKEDLVLNTKFYVENILQDQVEITPEGKFTIKDLDTNKKYKIRVTADGYQTRDYEINITQGDNQLFNFKLVENGSAIYPIQTGTNTYDPIYLYRSDFDGKNPVQLGSDTAVDYPTLFYSIEEQNLYYQSQTNKTFKQQQSSDVQNLPYTLKLDNPVPDRMTINTSKLNILTANFIAKKMLNEYQQDSDRDKMALQIMGLDGNNRVDVKVFDKTRLTFENKMISNNGKVVIYGYKENNIHYLNLFNVESQTTKALINGQDITLYDISEDGNLILSSRRNPSTDLVDLVLINVASDDLRTLKENIKGSGYQFQKGNTNKVLFYETRESSSNIYSFTIDRSQEERITSLTPDYSITGIYQESNLLFYFTNRGLLVLDIEKPKNFKLVSDKAYNYTK